MISIEDAIKLSKGKENISNGGSACFDFGDTVLVKYVVLLKYLKNGERAREFTEEVMEGINIKANQGINTPRHLGFKRVIEGDCEICYVLQEKCKGKNCAAIRKNDVTYDEMIDSYKYALDIPFEQYKKLVYDGCNLIEMGQEAKAKNLFYDEETGFWFIDFLKYDKEHPFNPNDIQMLKLAYLIIPSPLIITYNMKYEDEKNLTPEQKEIVDKLRNSIRAKTFMAFKSNFPQIEKYEKFLLADESNSYKTFLMENGFVEKDLFSLNEEDYNLFNEFYNKIISNIVDYVDAGESFEQIECNKIRLDTDSFGITNLWKIHKDNPVKDLNNTDYYASNRSLEFRILSDVANELRKLEKNGNIDNFLSKYELYCAKHKIDELKQEQIDENMLFDKPEGFDDFIFDDISNKFL